LFNLENYPRFTANGNILTPKIQCQIFESSVAQIELCQRSRIQSPDQSISHMDRTFSRRQFAPKNDWFRRDDNHQTLSTEEHSRHDLRDPLYRIAPSLQNHHSEIQFPWTIGEILSKP
jgi:hypothetical protein